MPIVVADRVRETTTTTGTGTITLAGAVSGYQSFAAIGNGDETYYTINLGAQWEVGIGTYLGAGPTLSRDTVLSSSNAGALVDFAAGTKDVFATYPAEKAVYTVGANIAAGSAVLGIANGGTGATTAGAALTSLGAYPASNPSGFITAAALSGYAALSGAAFTGPVSAAGLIESTTGGFKFPDGTTQTTAASGGGGSGTVTSVAASGGTTGLSFTGSPITTSGTLTLGGTLSVANGGTGATTLTGVVIGNGTSAFTTVTAPTGAFVGTTDAQTLNNKTFANYTETVFGIADAVGVGITPAFGPIQTWTLGANRTPTTPVWPAGTSMTLMIDDGAGYAINWSTLGVVWETNAGAAPTLSTTGYTVIVLWKVGTTIYGARVGDA